MTGAKYIFMICACTFFMVLVWRSAINTEYTMLQTEQRHKPPPIKGNMEYQAKEKIPTPLGRDKSPSFARSSQGSSADSTTDSLDIANGIKVLSISTNMTTELNVVNNNEELSNVLVEKTKDLQDSGNAMNKTQDSVDKKTDKLDSGNNMARSSNELIINVNKLPEHLNNTDELPNRAEEKTKESVNIGNVDIESESTVTENGLSSASSVPASSSPGTSDSGSTFGISATSSSATYDINALHMLTQERVTQLVQDLTHLVRDMHFTSDKIFAPGFNLTFLPEYKNPCWKENNTLLCLPYFFIGGFPKCGTTELFAKLITHPEILKGKSKEPHWWTRTRYQEKKHKLFDFYTKFFEKGTVVVDKTVDDVGIHPMVLTEGSASTVWDNSYLFSRDSYEDPDHLNIHATHSILPNAKFVIIMRNPVTRLYSDYLYFQKKYSPENFHEQVVQSIKIFYKCLENPEASFMYCVYAPPSRSAPKLYRRIRIALYYVHLSVVLSVYPRSNVFLLRLEDYMQDQPLWLRKIMTFLDVSLVSVEDITAIIEKQKAKNSNKKGYVKSGPMLNKTNDLLQEFYRPFESQLTTLL